MSYLGIDIGTSHTKIVEIQHDGQTNHLVKFALFPSNDLYSAMQDGSYNRTKNAINDLKKLLTDGGFDTNEAFITLPDHKIVTKVINLPLIEGDQNIQQAIEFQAEEHFPQPASEMSIKYTILKEHHHNNQEPHKDRIFSKSLGSGDKKGTMDVLVVAASKKLIDNYVFVSKKVGLEVMGLEPNSSAINRIIPEIAQSVPTIVLNLGYSYSDIMLMVDGNLRFIRNLKFGVNTLSRQLSAELNLNTMQADSYLFTYGFNANQLNGKIKDILNPIMSVLLQEFSRFQEYVEQRIYFAKPGEPNKVQRMAICGGGALIPNVIVYLIDQINMEVQFLDPWKVVNVDLVAEKELLKVIGPIFSSAIGTVLK